MPAPGRVAELTGVMACGRRKPKVHRRAQFASGQASNTVLPRESIPAAKSLAPVKDQGIPVQIRGWAPPSVSRHSENARIRAYWAPAKRLPHSSRDTPSTVVCESCAETHEPMAAEAWTCSHTSMGPPLLPACPACRLAAAKSYGPLRLRTDRKAG